jgi:hypothetical protein
MTHAGRILLLALALLALGTSAAHACPPQTVTGLQAMCSYAYGGVFRYCYDGAAGWWFKEQVINGDPNTCQPGGISQTTNPFQSASGCVSDEVSNSNGPPGLVAPCQDLTHQTVFTGPTKEKVEQCSYANGQLISVTSVPKEVKTTSGGTVTTCTY